MLCIFFSVLVGVYETLDMFLKANRWVYTCGIPQFTTFKIGLIKLFKKVLLITFVISVTPKIYRDYLKSENSVV